MLITLQLESNILSIKQEKVKVVFYSRERLIYIEIIKF